MTAPTVKLTASRLREISVSNALADAFLLQFLNRGWRPSLWADVDIHPPEYNREKGGFEVYVFGSEDEHRKAFAWLSKHPTFGRLLPSVLPGFADAAKSQLAFFRGKPLLLPLWGADPAGSTFVGFCVWRTWLRWVWSLRSERARQGGMAFLTDLYSASAALSRKQTSAKTLAEPVRSWIGPDPFRGVLLRAWAVASRLRACNNPNCRRPFFFAGRETQKFCSPKCAEPSERRRKFRWWRKHGDEWRRKQKAKARPKKRQRKRGMKT